MTDVSNINVKIDSTLGIDNVDDGKSLAGIVSKKLGTDSGITNITYTDDGLKIEFSKGTTADAISKKLQTLAFSEDEVKQFLGEDVTNVSFKENADGKITLTTTANLGSIGGISSGTTSVTKNISDFDIRELMKLLIAAFSELSTADRERALNVLNAVVSASQAKIEQMEIAKDEQYKSAMASAIGQIVSGTANILMAGGGAIASGVGAKLKKEAIFGLKGEGSNNINETTQTGAGADIVANLLNNAAMPLGKILEGSSGISAAQHSLAKSEADIEATKADQLLEILKQAQDQYNKGNDSLQQFIDKVINIMQQLLQSASQTEKSVANI